MSTNAGLWAYNTGDTVQFISLAPPKIIVSGRYKHFISAFGEHVIGSEVEKALESALEQSLLKVKEFTVAPMVSPKEGLPFHEWWIEFDNKPKSKEVKELKKVIKENKKKEKKVGLGSEISGFWVVLFIALMCILIIASF